MTEVAVIVIVCAVILCALILAADYGLARSNDPELSAVRRMREAKRNRDRDFMNRRPE